MYYYSENEAYDELREDFIDELKDQLQVRGKGEKLKLVAEGMPFEAITLKGNGELVCPSISMELVYINCYVTENSEIDEAVTHILGIFDEVEWIPRDQLEQIEHVLIYPINLAEHQDKLVEGNVAYLPYQDMAVTFQFWIEKEKRSYCEDVTKEHLEKWGIGVEELFEKARYRDLKEIGVDIVNMYDSLTSRFENDRSIFLRPADGVLLELKQVYNVYGANGFGAVFYPKAMELLHDKLGDEMLIIPNDTFGAYVHAQSVSNLSKLYEGLYDENERKEATGEKHHKLSDRIFKYNLESKKLIHAVPHKIEKHKMR
ncbi:TPA: hypothetical protein KOD02_000320 [Clostridioides difficile]|nr:hypothetical protein [Clostridioides difficile]